MRNVLMAAFVILAGIVLGSCSATPEAHEEFSPALAPLIGTNEDAADKDCNIVLLDVSRVPNGMGGYETVGNTWLWRGAIDVRASEIEAGAQPGVLFHYGSDPTWWEAVLEPASGAQEGYVRYTFSMYGHTPGPGMSGTSISRAVIELIPVLVRGNTRRFDHNRNPGEWDNYTLTMQNNWTVLRDEAICSLRPPRVDLDTSALVPEATLHFPASGAPELMGRIVAGGRLVVHYEPSRMTTCRDTHNGYPAWDLRAFVKFNPSGVVLDQSVRSFVTNYGVPTTTAVAQPAVFPIPADAASVEVWFWNSGIGGGYACQDYDSNGGANYLYGVFPLPGWVGNARVNISRSAAALCSSDAPVYASPFTYDSWARTRAAYAGFCFEVWQEGITDRPNPNLWQDLDVQVHYRFAGQQDFTRAYVDLFDQVGNNARYGLNLRTFDPFGFYQCPSVPYETVSAPDGDRVQASLEFFFTINGMVFRPENALFGGTYVDYASNPFRDTYCH